MKKHILIYSQYFYPEEFRINDICLDLVGRGYKVTVVTGIPDYPEGNFYKGYDWKKNREEVWNGIKIIRMPTFPRKNNKVSLSLNYLSFVLSAKLFDKKIPENIDFIFTYEVSPITQALPAIWYSKKNQIRHLLYVLDLWPDNVVAITNVKNNVIIKSIDKMVNYIYHNTDLIFASSNSFIDSIRSRSVHEKKLTYWPQYAEEIYKIQHRDNDKVEIKQFKEKTFVFAGNIGEAQGLEILVEASKMLKREDLVVKFIIIGDGRAKSNLIKWIKENEVGEYFHFIERQPAELIPYYLAKFDVALVTLSKNEIFNKTIPAKIQSIMACGKAMLVSADGECQDIVKASHSGFSSNAGDVERFVKNIKTVLTMSDNEIQKLGSNAHDYYLENFEKKMLMDKLINVIEDEAYNNV